MKRKYLYKIFAFFVSVTILFVSCTKETAEVRLDPTLSTSKTLDLTSESATVVGFVIAEGDGFTEKGVCYNTSATPTIENNKVVYTEDASTATFNVILSDLDYATTYYARAYATGTAGTIYGEEVIFTTLPIVPQLTTLEVSDITSFTASGGGNVTLEGGADVTARGVCFSETPNPTVNDNKTTDGDGLGEFTSSLTNLTNGTTYYVRAYATNSAGTGYGEELTFQTVAFPDAIYALGDGTAAGWDNNAAILIAQSETPGVYVEVLDLTASLSMKFIQNLGAWQPQWGQAKGADLGILGANLGGGEDPDAITTPDADGKYKVTVDLGAMTYSVVPFYPEALYALGDGTTAGWDNSAAILMPQTETPGVYEEILDLTADKMLKFIQNLGSWQPQWGQAVGADLGTLGVQLIESDPGVEAITTPDTDGKYTVTVDLKNMTYEIVLVPIYPEAMYLVGAGTAYGWDTPGTHDNAIMHKIAGDDTGIYWKICYLEAAQGFKVSAVDWGAPNLGFADVDEYDANGVTISESGGNMDIATSGMYMIVLDLRNDLAKLSIKPAEVYGIGSTFGANDWSEDAASCLFTIDNVAKTLTSPALTADGDIRMYANHAWIPSWWNAEFNVFSGIIEYRNDGGDQAAVSGTTGQIVTLSFDDNTGSIQ